MFRLETERLLIRPWADADRPAFAALARNPVVVRYFNDGVPFSEEEIDEFLARQARQLAQHDVCMGAMIEKETGLVVGVAGVQPVGTFGLEIGWWLSPDRWGRGYATEAGRAAMRHVLETLAQPQVIALIDPPNEASRSVATRIGMKYERRVTGEELGHRKPHIVVDLFTRERESP